MKSNCPECNNPIGFWEKFNTSRMKHCVCSNCGTQLAVPHHLFGLAAAICIPVVIRHFALQAGYNMPLLVQLLLPIPLLYVIFKFLLPLVVVPTTDPNKE